MIDTDELAVRRDGLRAVSSCPPDEARVMVRASILLALHAPPGAVARHLAVWEREHPQLVGTAPDLSPWSEIIEHVRAQHGRCRARVDNPPRGVPPYCSREAGHTGQHQPEPF